MQYIRLSAMRLQQAPDGALTLRHDKLAEPLAVPAGQLERWLIRLVRRELTPPALREAPQMPADVS